jgi:regulator of nonsense transcripts 3
MSAQPKGRPAGVLAVPAAVRRKANTDAAAAKTANRSPAPRLRLIIRRLPPGLTEAEFWLSLGEEWEVGKGKVEWAAYKDGKVSKE